MFLSLLPPSCIVASIRELANTFYFTISKLQNNFLEPYLRMTLLSNISMNINDFIGRNADNYNNMRDRTMTFNKTSSRTVSMFLSEVLVDYATKIEQLNDVSDKEETRESIDSL